MLAVLRRAMLAVSSWSLACISVAAAQPAPPRDRLVVYVYDVTDGAPLPQSTVTFVLDGEPQRRYTDEEGRFFVNVPLSGRLEFTVRRIGYAPATVSATLPVPRNRVEINLERTGTRLARVEVSGGPVMAGIVASSTSQVPIPGATVTMLGTQGRMQTDSLGRFVLPTERRTDITLSVSARGFAPRVVVDRLSPDESRERVILLDTIPLVGNRLYQNLDDRDQRLRWRGRDAGAVGARELREQGARGLADALRTSPSANARGLIFDDAACLFVDGDPRPGQTLASFPADEVELVEFYGNRGDVLASLAKRWPKDQPCGSGMPTANSMSRVAFVVVWTR